MTDTERTQIEEGLARAEAGIARAEAALMVARTAAIERARASTPTGQVVTVAGSDAEASAAEALGVWRASRTHWLGRLAHSLAEAHAYAHPYEYVELKGDPIELR